MRLWSSKIMFWTDWDMAETFSTPFRRQNSFIDTKSEQIHVQTWWILAFLTVKMPELYLRGLLSTGEETMKIVKNMIFVISKVWFILTFFWNFKKWLLRSHIDLLGAQFRLKKKWKMCFFFCWKTIFPQEGFEFEQTLIFN